MKTLRIILPFLFMLLGFTGCNKWDPPLESGPSIPEPRIYLYIQDKEGNDLLQTYDKGLIKDYYRASVTFNEETTFTIPLLEIGETEGKRYLNLDSTDAYGDFLPFLEKDNGTAFLFWKKTTVRLTFPLRYPLSTRHPLFKFI